MWFRKIQKISNSNPDGFTIVEVIVAALIFTIIAAGFFATLRVADRPSEETDQEVTAAFVGKQILEELKLHVRADTWTGGPLDPAGSPYAANSVTLDGITYNASYVVIDDPETNARKVTLTVDW